MLLLFIYIFSIIGTVLNSYAYLKCLQYFDVIPKGKESELPPVIFAGILFCGVCVALIPVINTIAFIGIAVETMMCINDNWY